MGALGGVAPAFDGMEIVVVEPGHEMPCPISGETHVVDDGNAVVDGRKVYLTAKHWRALRDLAPAEAKRLNAGAEKGGGNGTP